MENGVFACFCTKKKEQKKKVTARIERGMMLEYTLGITTGLFTLLHGHA